MSLVRSLILHSLLICSSTKVLFPNQSIFTALTTNANYATCSGFCGASQDRRSQLGFWSCNFLVNKYFSTTHLWAVVIPAQNFLRSLAHRFLIYSPEFYQHRGTSLPVRLVTAGHLQDLLCLFCGWVFSRFFRCLAVSSVGKFMHFMTPQCNQHFKKNGNVIFFTKSHSIQQIWARRASTPLMWLLVGRLLKHLE